MEKNLNSLFETITDYFSPKIIGQVNDVYIKLAKIKGPDVPWHTHDYEDEMFYVLSGSLTMEQKGVASFILNSGEFHIVPHGVEHRVHCEEECRLMLIENKGTKHTGDVASAITKSEEEQKY